MKTKLPSDFTVTPRMVELAKRNGWANPHDELEAFKDKHLAVGSRMEDWEAAFRTWLRNEKKWRKPAYQTTPPRWEKSNPRPIVKTGALDELKALDKAGVRWGTK